MSKETISEFLGKHAIKVGLGCLLSLIAYTANAFDGRLQKLEDARDSLIRVEGKIDTLQRDVKELKERNNGNR